MDIPIYHKFFTIFKKHLGWLQRDLALASFISTSWTKILIQIQENLPNDLDHDCGHFFVLLQVPLPLSRSSRVPQQICQCCNNPGRSDNKYLARWEYSRARTIQGQDGYWPSTNRPVGSEVEPKNIIVLLSDSNRRVDSCVDSLPRFGQIFMSIFKTFVPSYTR
jgi:hypothetical protein